MNLLEFSILYLACGAPFGVYYFFQKTEPDRPRPLKHWLHCLLISLFWFPFAIKLFTGFVTKRLRIHDFVEKNDSDSAAGHDFARFEARIAQLLLNGRAPVSLFEFREIFHRYLGLTLAGERGSGAKNDVVAELYPVVAHENPGLATICLNRRNRSRLRRHQILARQDFLQLIEQIIAALDDPADLSVDAFRFAEAVNDPELSAGLNTVLSEATQTKNHPLVKQLENEVWIPKLTDRLPTRRKALNLTARSASSIMSKTD